MSTGTNNHNVVNTDVNGVDDSQEAEQEFMLDDDNDKDEPIASDNVNPSSAMGATATDYDDLHDDDENDEGVFHTQGRPQLWKEHSIAKGTSFNVPKVVPRHTRPMTQMIQLIYQSGAPLYLLDSLMAIVSDSILSGDLKAGTIPTYDQSMKELGKMFQAPKARSETIMVSTGIIDPKTKSDLVEVQFPVFGSIEQFQNLFDSPVFEDIKNLVVNDDNPFGRYIPKVGTKAEIQDGNFFQDAVKHLSDKLFALGLTLFIDKTGATDMFQRFNMEPLMVTLTLLTEEQRRNPANWRCLGMIPKFPNFKNTTMFLKAYHQVLDVLLAPLVSAQSIPPIMRVRLGGAYAYVPVAPILINVIADNLGNESLTCRIQNRQGGNRLCRACHVSHERSSDVRMDTQCTYINQRALEKLTVTAIGPSVVNDETKEWFAQHVGKRNTVEVRNQMKSIIKMRKNIAGGLLSSVFAQHQVDNAFWKLVNHGNPRGIYAITATDPMHANELGLTPYCTEVIIGPLSKSLTNELNSIATDLIGQTFSTMRDKYPRINMSSKFTNLSRESADEKVGKMFLLALITETPRGREIISERCNEDFDANRIAARDRFKGKKKRKRKKKKKKKRQKTGDDRSSSSGSDSTHDNEDDDEDDEEEEEEHVQPQPDPDPLLLDPNDARDRKTLDGILINCLGLDFVVEYIKEMADHNQILAYKELIRVLQSKISFKDGDKYKWEWPLPKLPASDDIGYHFDLRQPYSEKLDDNHLYTTYDHDDFYIEDDDDVEEEEQGKARYSVDGTVDDVRSICQQLLAFHAMYSNGSKYPDSENNSHPNFGLRVKQMLKDIFTTLMRGGHGWCITKFHEFLHFVTDRFLFGDVCNFNGNKCESGLKFWQKSPSRTVGKNRGQEIFLDDIATRLGEHALVNMVHALIGYQNHLNPTHPTTDGTATTTTGTNTADEGDDEEEEEEDDNENWMPGQLLKAKYNIDEKGHCIKIYDTSRRKHKQQDDVMEEVMIKFLRKQDNLSFPLDIFTEVKLKTRESVRANGNWRKLGPWYDWVDVKFTFRTLEVPFEVRGFVYDDNDTAHVFGYSACDQTDAEKINSSHGLFEHWTLQQKPMLVALHAVDKRRLCFRVPESCLPRTHNKKVVPLIAVKDRHSSWADKFLDGSLSNLEYTTEEAEEAKKKEEARKKKKKKTKS